MKLSRRECLAATSASLVLSQLHSLSFARGAAVRHVATNTYPWFTFARRSGEAFEMHSDGLLAQIAEAGVQGYEPVITQTSEFEGLGKRLAEHGLEMRSLYVNSVLHDEAQAEKSIADVIQIAKAARELGTKIVVTNPSPIQWGGPQDKNDQQLRFQARSLDHLGSELRKMGMAIAYHNHDIELRHGAREYQHMLTATDPANVKFCLDAHWIYRGCGNSEVAVFDTLAHYHDRIVEIHLRQSKQGIWTESFSLDGDIDYRRLLAFLGDKGIEPLLVLEQAVEGESPNQLTAVEAHRRGRENILQMT